MRRRIAAEICRTPATIAQNPITHTSVIAVMPGQKKVTNPAAMPSTPRKITEAHRNSYAAKFLADFDATKKELEELVPAPSVAGAAKPAAQAAKGREDWKYEDWATKDMKGLQKLMSEDKEKFEALYEERYGSKPVTA